MDEMNDHNPWNDRPEMVALLANADEWWASWACYERWQAWCNDPSETPIFNEEFGDGDIDEDAIREKLKDAESNLIDSIRTASRTPESVALLRSVGAL